MNFTFSEEQQLLRDMVGRFIARDYPFEKRQAIKNSDAGWSRETWQALAGLGLLAINTQDAGEARECALNTMVTMNALGPGLLLEPYLESAVVATWLVRELGNEEQQASLLGPMAEGSLIAVPATLEPGSRFDLTHVETRAKAADAGFLLSGRKAVVAHAPIANVLLISARIDGAVAGAGGISLFAVPADAEGVTIDGYRMVDGRPGGEVTLANVRIPASAQLGEAGRAFDALERACDIGIAALAAEAVGIMGALTDITLEYLKTRRQFGQPIGRFQALQHRMGEMLVHFEQAKSISYLAAARCASDDAAERRRACSAAKVLVSRAGRFIRQQAVQLHGGMGVTDELNVGHYFKRLLALEATFGDADTHLERFIGSETPTGSITTPC